MSTLERRTSLSRRSHERHQHPNLEQHSPFRRARHAGDASHIPSPSHGSSARYHRRNFSQTGTLRGAFEVASRQPATLEDDDLPLSTTPYSSLGTPNSRQRQNPMHNAISPDSNPPNELAETYQQINDEGLLNDLELADDEFDTFQIQASRGRSRRLSSGSSIRGNPLFTTNSNTSYTDESPRRKSINYTEDEQRLKRATSNRSPVLSRSGTTASLTAENLQRREEEINNQSITEDSDDSLVGRVNVPATWGTRGKYSQGWLKNFTRKTDIGFEPTIEKREPLSGSRVSRANANRESFLPRPTSSPGRDTLENRPASRLDRIPFSDTQNRVYFEHRDDKLADGDRIPNTPITIYKNSTFTKRSPSKRDSQDLLRKLSRAESPPQNNNQMDIKTPEQPIRGTRVYDKTPIVTGAWVDTPMIERANSSFPEHLAKDNIPSPPVRASLEKSHEEADRKVEEKPSMSNWIPKWPRESDKPSQENVEEKQNEEGPETELQRGEKVVEQEEKVREERQEKDQTQQKRSEPEKPKDSRPKQNKPPLIKPDLPKSALETVLQDHKDNKDRLDVGDDTIESLQIIMDGQPDGLKTEEEEDLAYEKAVLEKLELANSGSFDMVDLDRLNGKLHSLSENINKIKVGLNSLEDRVSRDNDTISSLPKTPHDPVPPNQHTHTVCEGCETHSDGRIYASIPLPHFWKRDPISRSIRPTFLGWCTAVPLIWYFCESLMCDYYSHPTYATVCEGNCLLPDAPRFPFVIPTMLWRWLHLSAFLTPIWTILLAFFRLFAQLLGLWDGYVDEGPPVLNLSGTVWIHGSRVAGLPTATPSTPGFIPSQEPSQPEWEADEYVPVAMPNLDLGANNFGNDWESMDNDEIV